MRDGSKPQISFTLPKGISAAESNSTKEYQLLLVRDGKSVDSVTLYPFGASKPETLAGVDTSASSLPMQIFPRSPSPTTPGMRNIRYGKAGTAECIATAQYMWQELSTSNGDTPSIPWQ